MRDIIGIIIIALGAIGGLYVLIIGTFMVITGKHLDKYDDWNDID